MLKRKESHLRLIYLVRREKEWLNFQPSSRYEHHHAGRTIQRWNTTFNIKYNEFRKFLNDLRLKNLVDLKQIADIEVYDVFDERLKPIFQSKNALIFPTDDDDWFHPDVFKEAVINCKKYSTVRWPYTSLELNYIKILDIDNWPANYFEYQTNNYAFKTSNKNDLTYHGSADRRAVRTEEKYIPRKVLSIHNKSLASLSLNSKTKSQNDVLNWFEDCKKNVETNHIPDYFKPFVNEMTNFYRNELRLR